MSESRSKAEVLEPVLASDAALHLGHGEQSCWRDCLAALARSLSYEDVQPLAKKPMQHTLGPMVSAEASHLLHLDMLVLAAEEHTRSSRPTAPASGSTPKPASGLRCTRE